MIAPVVISGAISRIPFEAYVEQVPVPDLCPGDIIVMDNLSSQKGPRVLEMVEHEGANMRFLPAPDQIRGRLYSADFNPIGMAFSKLKSRQRKAAERTVEALWNAIGRIVDMFTHRKCANDFSAAGYDPD